MKYKRKVFRFALAILLALTLASCRSNFDLPDAEDTNIDTDTDTDTDTDGDTVPDASDADPLDPSVCADTDGDGCDDCASGTFDPANDGTDINADGICDPTGYPPKPDPMTWDSPPAAQLLVYEPFDYPVGPIHGLAVNAVGLTGSWTANYEDTRAAIETPGRTHPTLEGQGNCWGAGDVHVSPWSSATLDASVMAGHLDNGDALWFSFIGFVGNFGNDSNINTVMLALGTDSDNHVGIRARKETSSACTVEATFTTNGVQERSEYKEVFTHNFPQLFVGRVVFGEVDTVEVYLPAPDLLLPGTPNGVITGSIDQSKFSTLIMVINNGNSYVGGDEIRIGTTYGSVVGEHSAVMTATLASHPSGVEYYFSETSGNVGGSDSGWQTSASYEDDGLEPGVTYTYTVTARPANGDSNETAPSSEASVTSGQ